LANFLLQLFKLDFDRIGSLPSPQTESQSQSPTLPRPLTFKAQSILHDGGVVTFGTHCPPPPPRPSFFFYSPPFPLLCLSYVVP
jgi:hypothetical protein